VNPEPSSVAWFPLLMLALSAVAMVYLVRRSMRGMGQQDWILLRQARSRGLDLRQPQSVDFIVFAATEEAAADLASRMRSDGFETSIKPAQIQYARSKAKSSAPQDGWLVTGNRRVQLAPQMLIDTRKQLNAMSAEKKALYLGWQIADPKAPTTETTVA
jgi:Regulator of ribonuclease activity B